jgi:hypothetical protein
MQARAGVSTQTAEKGEFLESSVLEEAPTVMEEH